jgi:hypothetical protein
VSRIDVPISREERFHLTVSMSLVSGVSPTNQIDPSEAVCDAQAAPERKISWTSDLITSYTLPPRSTHGSTDALSVRPRFARGAKEDAWRVSHSASEGSDDHVKACNIFLGGGSLGPRRLSGCGELPSGLSVPEARGIAERLNKSVLSKSWARCPLPSDVFPRPSAIIFATLLYTRVLGEYLYDKESFAVFWCEYQKWYCAANFLEFSSSRDFFLTTFYLVCLLKRLAQEYGLILERVARFDGLLSKSLEVVIDQMFQPFSSIISQLIAGHIDSDQFLESFKVKLNSANSENMLPGVRRLLIEKLIHRIDVGIVNALIQRPLACTFGKAAYLNRLMTNLTLECSIELPLFRDSLNGLTMSATLCKKPTEKSILCPNLPAAVLFRLLENQMPDSFVMTGNDTKAFMRVHGVQYATPKDSLIEYQLSGSFDASGMDLGNWTEWVRLDDKEVGDCVFLLDYFR